MVVDDTNGASSSNNCALEIDLGDFIVENDPTSDCRWTFLILNDKDLFSLLKGTPKHIRYISGLDSRKFEEVSWLDSFFEQVAFGNLSQKSAVILTREDIINVKI